MNLTFAYGAILIVGLVACGYDVATRRIPNALTFGAAAAAFIFHLLTTGFSGLGTAGAGWALGIALFLPLFLLGGMGAGDVKLLGAIGAWLGPMDVLWVWLFASFAGGLMALILAVGRGYLLKLFSNLWCLAGYWLVMGLRPLPELTLEHGSGPRLPYALPIAAGMVVMLWTR